MPNKEILEVVKQYIDLTYQIAQRGPRLENIPSSVFDWRYLDKSARSVREDRLAEVQDRLQQAERYARENPLTDAITRGIFTDEDPEMALLCQRILRNPYRVFDDETLPSAKRQLEAVQLLQEYLRGQKELVQRWEHALEGDEALKRDGDSRIWDQQWKPRFLHRIKRDTYSHQLKRGWAVWFIGYPGSGKTTLAAAFHLFLASRTAFGETALIDGDMCNDPDMIIAPGSNLVVTVGGVTKPIDRSRQSRIRRAEVFGQFISHIDYNKQSIVVGASLSPYVEQRQILKKALLGQLFLVHVNTPPDDCRQHCHTRGYRANVWDSSENEPGIDAFEPPDGSLVPADMVVNTAKEPLFHSLERIVFALEEKGWLRPVARTRDLTLRARSVFLSPSSSRSTCRLDRIRRREVKRQLQETEQKHARELATAHQSGCKEELCPGGPRCFIMIQKMAQAIITAEQLRAHLQAWYARRGHPQACKVCLTPLPHERAQCLDVIGKMSNADLQVTQLRYMFKVWLYQVRQLERQDKASQRDLRKFLFERL